MKLFSLTKRFLVVDVVLVICGVSVAVLHPLAESYRTRRFEEAYAKLRHPPSEIDGWNLAEVIASESTKEAWIVQGNLNIVTAAYGHEETGERVFLRVSHWYHPIRCYVLNGWEMLDIPAQVLAGQEAKDLRTEGLREAHFRRGVDKITILFWEGSLTSPDMIQPVDLSSDTGFKQTLLRQVLTLRRRLQRFLLRGPIVVQVVCHRVEFSSPQRDAVIRFARGLVRCFPELLK